MKTVIAGGLMALLITPSFGCGCVDAPQATIASLSMNANYYRADQALANSLANLGETVSESYGSMNAGAMDVERITRLKKEQALLLKNVVFEVEKATDMVILDNKIAIEGADVDLLKAEKTGVLKAVILNQKSVLEE